MKKLVLPVLMCVALFGAAAQASDTNYEIEGGVAYLDSKKPDTVALLQLRLNDLSRVGSGLDVAVGPKIDVQLGFDFRNGVPVLPHADIAATLVRTASDASQFTKFGYEALTVNYQREVAIDLNHTLTVSLAGAWVDSKVAVSPAVKFIVKAVVDLVSVGYAQRLGANPGQLDNVFGWTPNVDAEVGFEILDRFRIVLGERAILALGKTGGTFVHGNEDPSGNATSLVSRSSITVSGEIIPHLTAFAQGSYALFAYNAVADRSSSGVLPFIPGATAPEDVNLEKGVWQLMFGVGGRW